MILGDEELASQFFSVIAYNIHNTDRISGHYPEVKKYIDPEYVYKTGSEKWSRNAGYFLESPREMLYQTLGKMIVLGGKLIFILGVTSELVEKFDNQNLASAKDVVKAKISGEYNEHEYSPSDEYDDEYEDEYPELDEFGNPNEISWLREYALHAEDFSRSQKADLFLNLEWNRTYAVEQLFDKNKE